MQPREIVRRAIEFQNPPRLPFWQHWRRQLAGVPDDVCNIWEMFDEFAKLAEFWKR